MHNASIQTEFVPSDVVIYNPLTALLLKAATLGYVSVYVILDGNRVEMVIHYKTLYVCVEQRLKFWHAEVKVLAFSM